MVDSLGKNSKDNPIIIRFSTGDDLPAIVDFYGDEARRTQNVLLRKTNFIKEHAEKGRFVLAFLDNKLIAGSALYTLAGGESIKCIKHSNTITERGRVVEIGSVLARWNDPSTPRGIWRHLLFGIPVIAALKFQPDFDLLVTEIFNSAEPTQNFVCGTPETGSRFRFSLITASAHKNLLDAFGATANEINDHVGRKFYRVSVRQNVVASARMLKEIMDNGYIGDMRPTGTIGRQPDKKVYVNMENLRFPDGSFRDILNEVLANGAVLNGEGPNIGWCEVRRFLGDSFSSPQLPLAPTKCVGFANSHMAHASTGDILRL